MTNLVENRIAYGMHLVFKLIASMNAEETDKNDLNSENQNRNDENQRQMPLFIADIEISESKNAFYSHRT
jgi:hypothetical protein